MPCSHDPNTEGTRHENETGIRPARGVGRRRGDRARPGGGAGPEVLRLPLPRAVQHGGLPGDRGAGQGRGRAVPGPGGGRFPEAGPEEGQLVPGRSPAVPGLDRPVPGRLLRPDAGRPPPEGRQGGRRERLGRRVQDRAVRQGEPRGVRQDGPGVDDQHHQGVRRQPLRAPGRDGEAGPEDGRHQGHPAAPGGVEHRRQAVAREGEGRLRQPDQGPGPQARVRAAAGGRTRARGPEGRLRGHERDHRRAAEVDPQRPRHLLGRVQGPPRPPALHPGRLPRAGQAVRGEDALAPGLQGRRDRSSPKNQGRRRRRTATRSPCRTTRSAGGPGT